jgi:hypothetical protein
LTNQFVEGRRVRFLHPLRLYLLVSIVFFLCARLIPVNNPRTVRTEDLPPEARARFEQKIAALKARHKELPLLESLEKDPRVTPPIIPVESRSAVENPGPSVSPATATPSVAQAAADEVMSEIAAGRIKKKPRHIRFGHNKDGPSTPFGTWMEQRVKDRIGEDGSKVKLFVETLRSNLSTMMLFCIPLFAFVLKLLYLRQKRFYIEHLVYALNIHAFFYIAVILVVLISIGLDRWIPGTPQALLTLALSLLVVVQIFLSIRSVYRQNWFMTTLKFAFGGIIYLFVLAFAVAATAIVTIALPD